MNYEQVLEEYERLTKSLKLVPRPVPAPLWNLSLANLARLPPAIARLWLNDDEVVDALRWLGAWWESLDRSGTCEVCEEGSAEDIDEVWRYEVMPDLKRGVAKLLGLEKVCKRCHLSRHVGLAVKLGKYDEVLTWIASVNLISLELARRVVALALELWRAQSRVREWSFDLSALPARFEPIERLLSAMARERRFVLQKSSVVSVIRQPEASVLESLADARTLLTRAVSGTRVIETSLRSLFNEILRRVPRKIRLLPIPVKLQGAWVVELSPSNAISAFRSLVAKSPRFVWKVALSFRRADKWSLEVYVSRPLDPHCVESVLDFVLSLAGSARYVITMGRSQFVVLQRASNE